MFGTNRIEKKQLNGKSKNRPGLVDQGFRLQSHTIGCQADDKDIPLAPWDWVMIMFLS